MVTFGPVWAEAGTMINKAKMTVKIFKRAGIYQFEREIPVFQGIKV